MPHTRGAKKAHRQNQKRRLHNRHTKKEIKLQTKDFVYMIKEGTKEDAQEEYNLTAKRLDKAAKQNIIHPNKAARKKRQLARILNARLSASDTPASED